MGGFLLLLALAVILSFFAFREGTDSSKQPMDYNSVVFAKKRLMKDKTKLSEEVATKDTSAPDIDMVYPSSKKYHRKGCRYASADIEPIPLTEAKSMGLSPCKICKS